MLPVLEDINFTVIDDQRGSVASSYSLNFIDSCLLKGLEHLPHS